MLNIVPFGAAVLEKKIFKPLSLCKSLSPWNENGHSNETRPYFRCSKRWYGLITI